MADEPTWLDAGDVQTVLGSSIGDDLDTGALQAACDGARSYVEGKRDDLVQIDVDAGTATFIPTGAVRLGTAMLAWRFYNRRTTSLGVLGFTDDGAAGILTTDPDVGLLLGIGRRGRFVFGGVSPCPDDELVIVDGGRP